MEEYVEFPVHLRGWKNQWDKHLESQIPQLTPISNYTMIPCQFMRMATTIAATVFLEKNRDRDIHTFRIVTMEHQQARSGFVSAMLPISSKLYLQEKD